MVFRGEKQSSMKYWMRVEPGKRAPNDSRDQTISPSDVSTSTHPTDTSASTENDIIKNIEILIAERPRCDKKAKIRDSFSL